jgi:UDP-glucuronate decarboxylase
VTHNAIVKGDLERIDQAVVNRVPWQGATVLMTGCAGFLGYYLMLYLTCYAAELGIRRIIGLDNFLLGKPLWLARLAEAYPGLFCPYAFDISRDRLEEIEGAKDARYVIHGAGIASPIVYRQHPVETIDANVWGLRRLLDFYRHGDGLQGLLFFSSSEIYGDPDPRFIPTREEYRGNVSCLGPRACYDESKRFGETLCHTFAETYKMPIIIARSFNNYGPGMRLGDKRLPADLAKAVVESRDLIIFSDGSPTRTFCYASDAVTGYLLCLLNGEHDFFNIGIDKEEISVAQFAEIYRAAGAEIFGYRGRIKYETSADPRYLTDNPNRRCPDVGKARTKLGYHPRIDVEEGVRRYLKFLHTSGSQEI